MGGLLEDRSRATELENGGKLINECQTERGSVRFASRGRDAGKQFFPPSIFPVRLGNWEVNLSAFGGRWVRKVVPLVFIVFFCFSVFFFSIILENGLLNC